MSQMNIGGVQPQQVNQASAPQAQGVEQKHDVPQELQNARVSTSLFAKIGHAIASLAHGISEAATYIASGIAAGLKSICSHFSVSDKAPEPRLQEAEIDPAFNRDLRSGVYQMRLEYIPAEYVEAGNAACEEVTGQFPGVNIRSMEQLFDGRNKPVRMELSETLNARGDKKITPGQFASDIKFVLLRQAKKLMLGEKISEFLQGRTNTSGKDSKEIASIVYNRLKNENSPLLAEFENAKTPGDIDAFFDKAGKVVEETLSLLDKLPGAFNAAKREATEKLAKLTGIPADKVIGASKKLEKFFNKLDIFSSNVLHGSEHVQSDKVNEAFSKKIDKFIGGIAGMLEEIDSISVSDELKANWKENVLGAGQVFPKEMRVVAKFSGASAKADVSALVNAINDGKTPEEIFTVANDVGSKALEQVFKENPEFREKWMSFSTKVDKFGADEQEELLMYMWSTIFDANPALREAFAKRPGLGEQVANRTMSLSIANPGGEPFNLLVMSSLTAYLNNQQGR